MRCIDRPFALFGVFHRVCNNHWNYCHTSVWWSFTLFFILGGCTSTHAQNAHQNLVDQLDHAASDQEKFQKILHYEEQRTVSVDAEYASLLSSTIDYMNQVGKPSTAIPIANTLLEYYLFGNHVNHSKALETLDKIRPHLPDVPYDSVLEEFYVLSGEANIYTNHPTEAIEDFKIIIQENKKSGNTTGTNYGYAHLKLAEIYASQWNILESDKYYIKASDFFLQSQDTTMYLWSLSGRSTLYSNNGLYHEAEEVRKKVFEIGSSSGDLQVVAIAHLSAALEYKDRDMATMEYEHLEQAHHYIDFPSEVRDYVKTITYALLTQYFSDQSRVDSTDHYFQKFTEFYMPERHGPWVHEYFQIASAYKSRVHHRYEEAADIANELIKEASSQNKLNSLSRLYGFLVKTYTKNGQKSRAFDALTIQTNLRDSLSNIQTKNQFLYYNQLFESERKDKQIIQQDASIQLLSARNKLLFWRGLWILFAISGLFLIIYLVRSYRFTRQKSRLQEEFSQNLIREQENERLRISQDLHDGISQDLILIKNTLDIAHQQDIADMVAGSLTQLRQVSRSLYPVTLKNFGLKDGLEDLARKADESMEGVEVRSHVEKSSRQFSSEEELHIYRIAQEALTNSMKYARCAQINVDFRKHPGSYILEVSDDGVGMDMEHPSFRQGVGMNSMEERARILGATLTIGSKINHGTHVTLRIPVHD